MPSKAPILLILNILLCKVLKKLHVPTDIIIMLTILYLEGAALFKKNLLSLLALITIGSLFISNVTHAAATTFEQGNGYSNSGYQSDAEQPTNLNWTGKSRFDAVDEQLTIQWNYGKPTSTAVIDNKGVIYYGSASGITAISSTGSPLWTFKDAVSQPVIGENGTIYSRGPNKFYAINPDGTLSWDLAFNGALRDIALGNENMAYIGSNAGNLYAVDLNDKSLTWTYNLGDTYNSHPAVAADGTIYVMTGSNKVELLAINPNGTLKWKKLLQSAASNQVNLGRMAPVIDSNGNIYVLGASGALYSVAPSSDINWKLDIGVNKSGPVLDEDRGVLYAFSTTKAYSITINGDINWEKNYSNLIAPVIDKTGLIYVNAQTNGLYILNTNGDVRTQLDQVRPSFVTIAEDGSLFAAGSELVKITGSNEYHGEDSENPEVPGNPEEPENPGEPSTPEPVGDRAIFTIMLQNGVVNEYDLSMQEVNSFIKWYEAKSNGTGPVTFAINKHDNNKGPFKQRNDYIIFDKIITFEVNEY